MKSIPYTLLLTLALATTAAADTIVQWNFNSVPPDTTTTTGTTNASVGAGRVSFVGGTAPPQTGEFASGAPGDPAAGDNSAWNTSNYPLQGQSNKMAGVQFNVSTVGFESIVVSWAQRNSGTASRYSRFQYSLDGVTFVDLAVFTMPDLNFANRTVNLNPILGANNNAGFAFRIVSEFESTATGAGTDQYIGTTSTYSANGTHRFDMVTVSGSLPDGNTFPTISSIQNQTTREGTPTDPLPFQVGDAETPADQLNVTGSSSNPTLVPDTGIIIEGTGANRTVTVGPNFDETGTTTITLYVIDGGGKSNSTSFVVTVLAGNTPPTISALTNVHTVVSTAFAPINFTVSDAEQSSDTLGVAAISSDQTIIPDGNLAVTAEGANRTLTMTPAPGQVGNCVISVIATDSEGLTTTRTFNAMIVPSSSIVLSEPFNYTEGPLTTNSGGLWTTRAGTPGQMQIVFGTVLVTASQSEDVVARLIGGHYDMSGSIVLYASFDISFSALPTGAPDIFAHFSGTNANDLRARVLTSTNAPPGSFRLAVANTVSSAANVVDYPLDLSLDTTYQVVVCYDVAAGTSKLWVNPASGGGWVNAIDPVLPTPINAYGLRQPGPNGRIGDSRMDNLLVGLSFEAVTPNLTHVRIRRAGSAVEVSWPSSSVWDGFMLQSTRSLANPDWQPVTQPAITVDGWDVVTITNPTGNEFFRLIKP
jgi:hypothetical protein